jgi:putative transposase
MHPIATMCRALGVSPGGYYARRTRPPAAPVQAEGELSAQIAAIHRRSQATYGVPWVHAELKAPSRHVGHKRVARLMSTAGLDGASRRRWVTTTVRDRAAKAAPDLLERNFTATAPNRWWGADISYIPTWAGFLYLAVVRDAFSRKIVGWAMETQLRTELVLAALNMALGQRRPAALIHHSDHGSQDTAFAFGQRCDEAGVGPSMGSVGDCFDHAMCESFLATLECERLDRHRFKPRSKHAWQSSSSSSDGITRIAVTRLSTTSHQSITNEPTAPNSTFRAATNSRLKNPRPPPAASGKIEDRQGLISIKKIGEPLNQSPSPTPSTESR